MTCTHEWNGRTVPDFARTHHGQRMPEQIKTCSKCGLSEWMHNYLKAQASLKGEKTDG